MQEALDNRDSVDITPDPRILKMLGEIAFEPHKCIGELIDNSIDAFINEPPTNSGPTSAQPQITIRIPNRREIELSLGQIVVEDNGSGMTFEQVINAARAGFSGNTPLDNLGLFGMGFNIATARLGRVTQLRSGRVGMERWSIIEIDLDSLQQQRSFRVTPRFEPKRFNDHGTRITISHLKSEQAIQIASGIRGRTQKSVAGLRKWIGRTYAKYLSESVPALNDNQLSIVINSRSVDPYKWCVWDNSRYVEIGSRTRAGERERIQAHQPIDLVLGEGEYCTNCLSWMPEITHEPGKCNFCQQPCLVRRERKMKGWIGIQRHLHPSEFGFDFLRNGRAILQWDKRMFTWRDPDEGIEELEYPIDQQRSRDGRIVGEIEIDHVPVHYQKDSFEEDSPLWAEVLNSLRGTSPLRQHVARRKQLPQNESFLADIYRGFNRTRTIEGGRVEGSVRDRKTPWARDLIIDQSVAEDYYRRFLDNDPDYQDDSKWFEWMEVADRERDRKNGTNGPPKGGPIRPNPPRPREKSEQELLRESGELDDELSGSYGIEPSREVNVNVYRTTRQMWVEEGNVRNGVPIRAFRELDGTVECFYDQGHPRLSDDDSDLADFVIAEVSSIIREMYYERYPFSYVYGRVRAVREHGTDSGGIERQAQRMLDELSPLIVEAYVADENATLSELRCFLSEHELSDVRRAVAESGGDEERLEEILNSADFLTSLPMVLGRIIRAHPERFLDNRLFALAFANVPALRSSVEQRQIGMDNAGRVANLIEDLASVLSPPGYQSSELRSIGRRRALSSHDLLRALLVTHD